MPSVKVLTLGVVTLFGTLCPQGIPQAWLFTENVGQCDSPDRFYVTTRDGQWSIGNEGITTVTVTDRSPATAAKARTVSTQTNHALEIAYIGRTGNAMPFGEEEEAPATFLRPGWTREARRYGRVRIGEVYHDIDALIGLREGQIKLDWVLRAGARMNDIALSLNGATGVAFDENGIVVSVGDTKVTFGAITAYSTDAEGKRTFLDCEYVRRGESEIGYRCRSWNGVDTLVVDPGLQWSSYVGGAGYDVAYDVKWIDENRVAIAGSTNSVNFPVTPGSWSTSGVSASDAFVSILDLSRLGNSQLIYSSYIGGSSYEAAIGLAVLPGGRIGIAGETWSQDFPTTAGAYDASFNGGTPSRPRDCFACVLDPTLSGRAQLVYGTFLGGRGDDDCYSVEQDANGRFVIGGQTDSPDFPTTLNAYIPTLRYGDGFLAVVDPGQVGALQLAYSTFIGGGSVRGISAHSSGLLGMTGEVSSMNLRTTPGAAYPSFSGGSLQAYAMLLDPSMPSVAQLQYCTYLGGSQYDAGWTIGFGPSGLIYVGGTTESWDFPLTASPLDHHIDGLSSGFLSVLDPSLLGAQQLRYSTFIDGSLEDYVNHLCVDRTGIVDLIGVTGSPDFPTTSGAYMTNNPLPLGNDSAFMMRLDPLGPSSRQLLYSSLLGGGDEDWAYAGSRSTRWAAAITGSTRSLGFPTTASAWRQVHQGGSTDGFAGAFDMLPTGVSSFGVSTPGCFGPVALTVNSMPRVGNSAFEVLSVDTPPSSFGVLVLGSRSLVPPVDLFGARLYIDPMRHPILAASALSLPRGIAVSSMQIPRQTWLVGQTVYAQSFWAEAAGQNPCPPLGLSASHALAITLQT